MANIETLDLTATDDELPPLRRHRRHRQQRINDQVNDIYGIDDDGFRRLDDLTSSEDRDEDEEPLDGHDTELRGGLTLDQYTEISAINDSIIYDSYALCEAAVHAQSAAAGFEYAKPGGRKFKDGQLYKQPLVCAKGMSKRNLQATTEHRDVDSKKSGCPMSISLDAVGDGKWKGTFGKSDGSHNHAATQLSSLANHRRRARGTEVRQFLLSARQSGASPKVTRELAIKQFCKDVRDVRPVIRDIYNEWAHIRSLDLNSHTPVERVLECLRDEEFFVRKHVDNDNRLTHLFFAHPELIQIYKANGDILMVDCTYCTQEYGLPLLCFVSITRIGVTVPLAHALLFGESEGDYNWAFTAFSELCEEYEIDDPSVLIHDRDRAMINLMKQTLPHMDGHRMLCMWHMNTDVEAKAGKHLGTSLIAGTTRTVLTKQAKEFMGLYRAIINSQSESDYDAALEVLRARAYEGDSDNSDSSNSDDELDMRAAWIKLFTYLNNQWFGHHKELCVKAWTNKVRLPPIRTALTH